MYSPIANTIEENFNYGTVIFPNEVKNCIISKMNIRQFLRLDYRLSNPILIAGDTESNSNVSLEATENTSNYILGFVVVRNVKELTELSRSSKSTITRFYNKIFQTVATTLSQSSLRKNRGNRSIYLDNESIDIFQSTVDSLALKPSGLSQWNVFPFLMSTTIFYNDFRANLGVGIKKNELENIENDIQNRLAKELDIMRDKINKRIDNPITDCLFGKVILVSPKELMNEKYGCNVFDYIK